MPVLLWILVAAAIGSMLAYRFGGLRGFAPRWAAGLLICGAGTATGIGITSIIFFICRTLVPGFPVLPMLVELALAAWLGFEIYRRRAYSVATPRTKPFAWNVVLALVLLIVVGVGTLAMTTFWEANPQGNWDAWAIWNLRARFLASGGHLATRAWSPILSSHPEYPLLVSGFVARLWIYSGSTGPMAPAATSYALFLALLAISTGGIAALESGSLGLLFGLVLAGSPFLLHEVPAQYADVPLAAYLAGALLLMLLERPLAAGVFASLAAWTKDEGSLFIVAFLAWMAIAQRRRFPQALAGAIPVGTLVLVFKLFLARGASSLLAESTKGAGLGPRLTDFSRYLTVARAAIEQLWNLRLGWYHPILPLLVLALTLKFKANWRRDVLPAGALTAAMLAGYFFVFIITPNDLNWQLETTSGRLAVQLWPAVLITIFAGLRAPEHIASELPKQAPPTVAAASQRREAKPPATRH